MVHGSTDPLDALAHALAQAIAHMSGTKRWALTDGACVRALPRGYQYTFSIAPPCDDIPDGMELQLSSPTLEQAVPVQVMHAQQDRVIMSCARRLPPQVLAEASVAMERDWVLRKMAEAFQLPATPAQLGRKLLGLQEAQDAEAPASVVETLYDLFRPDEAQHRAIARALASELLVLLGPPGTGKTDTLAAIALLHVVLARHRVLIVSHTNIAIDNAILRLAKFVRQRGLAHWFEEHRVLRYGDPQLEELGTEDYRGMTVPLLVEDAVRGWREELARLEQQRDALTGTISRVQDEVARLQRWRKTQGGVWARRRTGYQARLRDVHAQEQARRCATASIAKQQEEARRAYVEARRAWHEYQAQWHHLQEELRLAHDACAEAQQRLRRWQEAPAVLRWVRSWFFGEQEPEVLARMKQVAQHLDALRHQRTALQQHACPLETQVQTTTCRLQELHGALAAAKQQEEAEAASMAREKLACLRQLQHIEEEEEEAQKRMARLSQQLATWTQDLTHCELSMARLEDQIAAARREAIRQAVQQACVVGATLTGLCVSPVLLAQEWDVVIIDEASMAPPPAVVIAANRAAKQVIVVGDPLQLAPVCKDTDREVNAWLGRDMFALGGYSLREAALGRHHSVLLPYQGRMASAICDLVRGPVYQGQLKDRPAAAARLALEPEKDAPVVLYDTSQVPHVRALRPPGGSRHNPYQAGLSVKIAQQMLADLPASARTDECLGIITPYVAQRDRIRDLVKQAQMETYVRVGTVFACQGLEFTGLILDLVEGPGLAIAPFLRGAWGSQAMRILNVAITRARDKVVIVAHRDTCLHLPSGSMLPTILELAAQKRWIKLVS